MEFSFGYYRGKCCAGPNNAQPGLQLGHYRQHGTCGDTLYTASGDPEAKLYGLQKLAALLVFRPRISLKD